MPDTLISEFVRVADQHPGRPALDIGDDVWSYADLAQVSAQIAGTVRAVASDPQPPVGLLAYRSLTAYAGVVGGVASGWGYTPLHPDHPGPRSAALLGQTGTAVVVVGSECVSALDAMLPHVGDAVTFIFPDTDDVGGWQRDHPRHRFIGRDDMGPAMPLEDSPANAESLAYILFTSGSTGAPKGVPIRHRNVVGYVRFIRDRYQATPEDRFSQTYDFTFDPSVHDMWVCWTSGGCLCPVPKAGMMAPGRFIRDKRLTIWSSVPSVAAFMSRLRMLKPGAFPALRWSMFCGEPLPVSIADAWQVAAPNSAVENQYGPTEITITVVGHVWDSTSTARNGSVPMGEVFNDQRALIVGDDDRPVPDGTPGELCVSGSQVADGYWNNPEQTQRSFVRLPGQGDARWYRTGDRVLRDAYGVIHYVGRLDSQVKIRGQRTELQEIDHALRQAARADVAVAVPWPVHDGKADGIVGFIQADGLDEDAVMDHCRQHLPPYMVPQRVVAMEQLPLNLSGKVDRGELTKRLDDGAA